MAEKRIAKSTTGDQASSPVPKARAEADPKPAKATKRAKATKTTKAAKTAKGTKAPVKKAAKAPAAKAPARKATTPAPVDTGPAAPGSWTAAVREALSHPGQPPQRLAELAVAEFGPRAAAWAGWLRDTYPDPPAHGIARLAAHEARQLGWALSLAEAGGPAAAALSLPATAWVRATLVLRIAAAYGHDATDPRRAAELIELLDLMTVTGPRRLLSVAARLGARRAPARAALRMLLAAGDHGEQIERLAHRAAWFYRRATNPSR